MAPYLIDSKFSIQEKLLLFRLRTRMVDVKSNFSNGVDDISCDLCFKDEPQTQQHLLVCTEIMNNCPELVLNNVVVYDDLFKKSSLQLECVRLFTKVLETKQKLTSMGSQI